MCQLPALPTRKAIQQNGCVKLHLTDLLVPNLGENYPNWVMALLI